MAGDREDEEPMDADLDPRDEPNADAADTSADGEDRDPVDEQSGDTADEADGTVVDQDREAVDSAIESDDDDSRLQKGYDHLEELDEHTVGPGTLSSDDTETPTLETLEDIDGIGTAKADALREAGFHTVDDVRSAAVAELTAADGIGETLAANIKADVGDPEPPELDETETVEDEQDDEASTSATNTTVVEDDESLLSGPETDQEMPLTAHIEEMLKRLAIVVAIAGVVSLVTFPFAEYIINLLWYNIMPGVPSEIARPRLYGILELMFTKLKVASLAGLLIALPALVYETYQFMRPGLYPHERRYYLAAVPASLVLALVGVTFAYFIVLPAIFTYFLAYSQDVATIGFALGRTFNLILVLMGYLALVFQIPLFIMLAMMMGIVTRRWLANRRLLFWGAFLGISFLFSPDPTGMAPVMIALTMVALFEGTLLLTKWAGRE